MSDRWDEKSYILQRLFDARKQPIYGKEFQPPFLTLELSVSTFYAPSSWIVASPSLTANEEATAG
ncbi:hypothetical protein AMTR_s00514p00012710, partial [Amborella trichopoda]